MCFSAQASFIAGFGLLGSSIYYLRQKMAPQYRLLKLVPLLFGIQQLCEGVVWLTQEDPQYQLTATIFKYFFLFFAFFLWPFYVPTAMFFVAKNMHQKIQLFLMGLGFATSSILAWLSYTYGVVCRISCHHVEYFFPIREHSLDLLVVFYCIATIGSFFFTDNRRITIAGILIGTSAFVSWYIYTAWFTSVWCFFAAALSGYIFLL